MPKTQLLLSILLSISSSFRVLAPSSKDRIWMDWTFYESGNASYRQTSGNNGYAFGRYSFNIQTTLIPFMFFASNYDPLVYSVLSKFTNLKEDKEKLINNPSLIKTWETLHKRYPFEFGKLQDVFAYKTFYVHIKEKLMKELGINLDNHSPAVKGTAFSIAVRFSEDKWIEIFKGINDKDKDIDIIDKVYDLCWKAYGNEKRWRKDQQWGDAIKAFKSNYGDQIYKSMDSSFEVDKDWAHQNIQELNDFIESQGVYIRQ